MVRKIELTQEQSRWFAEQIIEWAAANIGSRLVIEVEVDNAIGRSVTIENIETSIEVIQKRLSDSALDPALISILGVLGIKALAEQISKDDNTFDLETSQQVCDTYAAEHSIDIDGASLAILVRLMHTLEHPGLPDLLEHSNTLTTEIIKEIGGKLLTGEIDLPHIFEAHIPDEDELPSGKYVLSQYEALKRLKRSTPSTRHFIGVTLCNMDEASTSLVAAEMKNILAARHPSSLRALYDNDARGG
ncbi:MAG: hypothetical protein ACLFTK_12605 [Anaerolineales bacterium]